MAQIETMVRKDMTNKSWWCQGYVGWAQWESRSDLRKGKQKISQDWEVWPLIWDAFIRTGKQWDKEFKYPISRLG